MSDCIWGFGTNCPSSASTNLNRETTAILAEARESRNHVIALQAIGRAEKQLELEARLVGELSDSARIAVGINVTTPQPERYDLRLLSPEELEQLELILTRAEALTRAALSQGRLPAPNE